MPTYEYSCKRCGDTVEVFQSFSDKPLRKHQVCGGDLQKVFHARGVVFKGSGFYTTDSRSSSRTNKKEPSTSSASASSSKSSESGSTASTGTSSSGD